MNKKIIIFLLIFFVLFYISTTIFVQKSNQLVFAQNNNQPNSKPNSTGNDPNQNENDRNTVNGNNINIPKGKPPGEFIRNIYIFFLSISGMLAFFVLIWGGVQRVINAGNPEKIKDADEWIKGALWGLLLLFGAWLLLHTINPNLVELQLPSLQEIKVEERPKSEGGGAGVGGGGGGAAGPGLSESDARSRLLANGITVNAQPPQTSLNGIKQATIDEIIRMKKQCDAWMKEYYKNDGSCNIIVTGGTENGPHAAGRCSHGNGYKIDLGLSPRLDEFIQKTYCCKNPKTNQCGICDRRIGDGALMYKSPTGAIYARESDHWDIQANFACP